jgi:iron only hydrogenase large subunit-like protein/uncharacterized Fe-S cluster-containing protein
VKAIQIKNEQAYIIQDQCILCGHCLEVCPQNAKRFASDMGKIHGFLGRGEKVVVSVAPAFMGILPFDKPGQVVDALLKLGFTEVRETAEGARYVTEEYRKLLDQGEMQNVITTCCPAVNDLIEKYYPSITEQMAPVVSPMVAHGRLIKKMYGSDVKVVFLGPCIAKKGEAENDERVKDAIDAVFTFEEFMDWLAKKDIRLTDCEDLPMANAEMDVNRLYPISGGVIDSVNADCKDEAYEKVHVDGVSSCMELFDAIEHGQIKGGFFEVNVCEGGCIKGPGAYNLKRPLARSKMEIQRRVDPKEPECADFRNVDMHKEFDPKLPKMPRANSEQIRKILNQMHKFSVKDELNCGACGYATCRDKAEAVFQGKAEISMCLPYALANAESMSNIVMDTTPNLIFIVDSELRVRECNKRAQKLFHVSHEEALESYIFEMVDETDIVSVLDTKEPITHKRLDLEQIGIKVEEQIAYIESMDSVLVIYRDVTSEEEEKEKNYNLKMEAVQIAQQVIDKQMMVAQEIAGLLGETTAETKVTLTTLRDSLMDEGEEG